MKEILKCQFRNFVSIRNKYESSRGRLTVLWAHVTRAAPNDLHVVEPHGHAEIAKLHALATVHEEIEALDIGVNDFDVMKVRPREIDVQVRSGN